MGQWQFVGCIIAVGTAALVFLSLVAHELDLFERVLEYRHSVESERAVRRQAMEERIEAVDGHSSRS